MRTNIKLLVSFGMICTFFAAFLMVPKALSQSAKSDQIEGKRLAYVVQRAEAGDLASVLKKHFGADADFEAAPSSAGNMLLINAKAAVIDEVLATLAKVDRRPQAMDVEVILLDVVAKKAAEKRAAGDTVDEKQLSGAIEDVHKTIKALEKSGAILAQRRYQVTAAETKKTNLIVGGSKPYVTGSQVTTSVVGKPTRTNTVNYKDVGISVGLIPSVGPSGLISIHLDITETSMFSSLTGVEIGKDENGAPVHATEFGKIRFEGKVELKSGHAVVAKDLEPNSPQGGSRTIVIVCAKVTPQ